MPLPAGRTEVNQGTLKIKNLNPADGGLYECTATNTMGTKKARINMAVQQQKLRRFGKHSTLASMFVLTYKLLGQTYSL